MRKLFLAVGLLVAGFAVAAPLRNIVVFGDSLSDNGNLYEYMKHQLPQSPPYYQGRFTNGPVWIETLTASYFPENPDSHLIDYAFGGAGVSEEEDSALITVEKEIKSYLLAHHDRADPESLYVVWIGANNYLAIPEDTDQAVAEVSAGIHHSLELLANKGARTILVVNLPDLGRTPLASDPQLASLLSEYASKHNEALMGVMSTLRQDYPQIQWIDFDVKTMLADVIDNPKAYGFSNITDTCYEAVASSEQGGKPSLLKMVASVKPKSRPDACKGYLFFDPVHPTELAHQIMAQRARLALDTAGIEFIEKR